MDAQDTLTKALLVARSAKGNKLSEGELGELERLSYLEALENRPAVDFAEVEASMGFGLDAAAIRDRNARWSSLGPKQPQARKPFFSDAPIPQPPESITLCGPLYRGRRGIERMLDAFRSKLSEVMETGRLP